MRHCLKAAHRFCASPPPQPQFKIVGCLPEASLLLVMTKDRATMLVHSVCTQIAVYRCAHKAVKAVCLFVFAGLQNLCFI